MRVLQVMSGAERGGAETFFVDLVGALHRAGLEQRVAMRNNEARVQELRCLGLNPVELPFRPWLDFKTQHALQRQIEEFRPHIVQTWMSRASTACPKGNFIHVGWLGGYYNIKYFRKCQELVGVTQDLVEHVMKSGWPREHSHYLPTLSTNAPAPPLRRSDFQTPDGIPLILALGRLHEVKGFDVLLDAMSQIPEVYLWLAGEGHLRSQLEEQTRKLGLTSRVRFLGWRTDRAALFASCDMCVMPSREEPFGTVMIEAWAYRRPIIAAAAKGPSALIKHGENGLLIPIDDAPALAAAIKQVINNRNFSQHIVNAGYATYETTYTEAKIVEQYLDFYQTLIKKKFVAA